MVKRQMREYEEVYVNQKHLVNQNNFEINDDSISVFHMKLMITFEILILTIFEDIHLICLHFLQFID